MSISLKPHNVETYQKVIEKFKETKKVAVVHPTGTGKMYVALKLLEDNNEKKAIYVSPSTTILHDVKKNILAEGMMMSDFPELTRITYAKLARLTDEEIEKLSADIIILDEFHHCGAPEWGRGVEKLLQRNTEARVLGLSATPLRYTDGLRDMADELFENNIASEMTLEDAIENGILPEASYVSTVYGYVKEFDDMQANIDKIKDEDKREEAQGLLNTLKDKLDENTQNLPELLSEYMKNKHGKYIIFCRNIDDMNEKMEQAQTMFESVNSNITIRGVSSQIRISEEILKDFEQDSNEGTLKLLYAVDMLNEGYHINDLDGVIMMRPTFSPTIYTQQLGRALTVGGSKKPVVIDLVNNFDSCKIIEDFAERMRQYKENDETEKSGQKTKSRLSIFDKTKEFREIAERITELSRNDRVTFEQKIEIFTKFMQTGENLVGNTTFEGYPIGQWAIEIRRSFNRINEGTGQKTKFNFTEEQIEQLKDMGILERKFDKTLEEKIDYLIEWRKKYPEIKIMPIATDREIRKHVESDEEFSQIKEEYEKIQKYYDYIRTRKRQGKLSEEQISKAKEGDIGGVFGIPTRVEELAKKYSITVKDADRILTEYGTLENFYNEFKKHNINSRDLWDLAHKMMVDIVDIDNNPNQNYKLLLSECRLGSNKGLIIFSSKKLNAIIEKLDERHKSILESRYGLVDGTSPKTLAAIASEMNITPSGVRQLLRKTLTTINCASVFRKNLYSRKSEKFDFFLDYEKMTDEEIKQADMIQRNIQLRNGDFSENLKKLKVILEKIETRGKEEKVISKGISIEDVNFSVRAYNCLKRSNINTLDDLSNLTIKDLMRIKKLTRNSLNEVLVKMDEYGITLKDEETKQTSQDSDVIRLMRSTVGNNVETNETCRSAIKSELSKEAAKNISHIEQ